MMNLNIEKSILGLILSEEGFDMLEDISIKADYFSSKCNKIIFDELCNMHKDNQPISTLSLIESLRQQEKLEDCNGVAYITSLLTFATTTTNLEYYVEVLKELYIRRNASIKIIQISQDLKTESFADIAQKLNEIQESINLQSNYENVICDISDIQIEQDIQTLNTGFYKLDKALEGIELGTLSVLTGEPGSGKTTLLNQIIANVLKDKNKVFLYSGELTHSKVKTWFFQTLACEKYLEPCFSKLGEFEMKPSSDFIKRANNWIKDKLFMLKETQCLNIENLRGILVYLHKIKGVNLFVLDNLMTLTTGGQQEQLGLQKQIVLELKQIAKELGVAIVLVAHPNKESIKFNVQNMFSISGASEIVNLADYVFKLVPEDEEVLLYILKNRISGRRNVYLSLKFDKNRKRFYSGNKAELYQKYI